MQLTINGEKKKYSERLTVEGLLQELALDPRKVAVERNLTIVPRSAFATSLEDGDAIEIVHFIGGGEDSFLLAGTHYRSRLLVGTGKYSSTDVMLRAIEASGAEIVTVALRRVNLQKEGEPSLLDALASRKLTLLPNSAGCKTAEEAVRTLRLARELGGWTLVKLEVMAEGESLLPHPEETLKAASMLVNEGFSVMAYTNDDLEIALKLEDLGCAAVMPLAAPIGTGLGILRPDNIRRIVDRLGVPVLVDAGIGTASDAAIAMELGCAGVLLNTAIAQAKDHVRMASSMRHAVIAGREAWLAGRMEKRDGAVPSSPTEGKIRA